MHKIYVVAILLILTRTLFGGQEDCMAVAEALIALPVAMPVADSVPAQEVARVTSDPENAMSRGQFNIAVTKTASSNDKTLAQFLALHRPSLQLTMQVEHYVFWLEKSVNKSGTAEMQKNHLPGYKKVIRELAIYKQSFWENL